MKTTPIAPSSGPTRNNSSTATIIVLDLAALKSDSSIGGDTILSYELDWDNGTNSDPTIVLQGNPIDSLSLSYTSNSLITGSSYNFKYRAKNNIGWGPFSPTTSIVCGTSPNTPDAPSTVRVSNNITVNWTLPSLNGGAVVKFNIYLMRNDGNYNINPVFCDGSQSSTIAALSCTFDISNITSSPFNLSPGSLIIVKLSLTNSFGDSSISSPNTSGATV